MISPSRQPQSGFTLIELMAILVIAALITLFAGRSARAAIYAARSNTGLSTLMAALTTARSAAANTEIDVVLCPSMDGETCSSGFHWEKGWIAFQATHAGSNRTAGEPIVQRVTVLPAKVHLVTSAGRTRIRFQGNGGNAGSNATFTFCDGRGSSSASAYAMANNGNLRLTTASATGVEEACAGL